MSTSLAGSKRARTDEHTEPTAALISLSGGEPFPSRVIDLWQARKFCDATVAAGNRSFEVHRLVLASASDFFDGSFSAGLAESASARVELAATRGVVLESALQFAYTGRCDVEEAHIVELLEVASFLRVGALVEAAAAAVEARLAPHNCLGAIVLAEAHSLAPMATAAQEMALRHFEACAASDTLCTLTHAQLLSLLSDERLEVARKETVHEAVRGGSMRSSHDPTLSQLT